MLPATTTYTGWNKPVLLSSIGTDEAGFWNSKVMIKKGDKIADKMLIQLRRDYLKKKKKWLW